MIKAVFSMALTRLVGSHDVAGLPPGPDAKPYHTHRGQASRQARRLWHKGRVRPQAVQYTSQGAVAGALLFDDRLENHVAAKRNTSGDSFFRPVIGIAPRIRSASGPLDDGVVLASQLAQ
jgi:hypothetical protein